jgi:Clp amino terminal domain, pathogenicity island component
LCPFERFTERGKKVLTLAQEAAERSHHSSIGTEHLLLGLLIDGEGIAADVLEDLGANRRGMRRDQNGLGLCNITKCCTEGCPATGSIPESTRLRRMSRSRGLSEPYSPGTFTDTRMRQRNLAGPRRASYSRKSVNLLLRDEWRSLHSALVSI